MAITDEEYLGDGLYVGLEDGYQIVLAANDRVVGEPTDRVFLDSGVLESFLAYIEKLKKRKEEAMRP